MFLGAWKQEQIDLPNIGNHSQKKSFMNELL